MHLKMTGFQLKLISVLWIIFPILIFPLFSSAQVLVMKDRQIAHNIYQEALTYIEEKGYTICCDTQCVTNDIINGINLKRRIFKSWQGFYSIRRKDLDPIWKSDSLANSILKSRRRRLLGTFIFQKINLLKKHRYEIPKVFFSNISMRHNSNYFIMKISAHNGWREWYIRFEEKERQIIMVDPSLLLRID